MSALADHAWGKSLAADRVWAEVCGLAPSRIGRECLMLFQAYVDDSSQGNEIFVLGGHAASVETWARFSAEWEVAVAKYGTFGPSGARRFKMAEVPIDNEGMWKVRLFYKIIESHNIVSLSCCLKRSDLLSARKQIYFPCPYNIRSRAKWKKVGNIFTILFRILLQAFNQNRQIFSGVIPADASVNFFFDKQREEKIILDGWDQYLNNRGAERHLYGSAPRFENDERFMPLQAADLWAWWIREKVQPDTSKTPEARALIEAFHEEMDQSPRKIIHGLMNQTHALQTLLRIATDDYRRQSGYQINLHYRS